MSKIKFKNIFFLRLLHQLLLLIGIFFFICLVLSFTEQPYWAYHWLGTSKSELKWKPSYIILLGGGGMPSQSNLMRSWYTEKAAKSFPQSKVMVAMPGNLNDSLSTPQRMKNELVMRGVSAHRINFEPAGTNTRSQALECQRLIKMQEPILLVSSPEHMRRAVLAFRKVGFEKINAVPAFENAAEADFSFTDDELGGNTVFVPDVGNKMNVRYQIWNHLKYEIIVAREMVALAYYRIRGWI